jgi:NADH pyrophosphatase NudC (nudix superfamily)
LTKSHTGLGGRVELGENATTAAEREVVEESGVAIKVRPVRRR